MKKTESKKIQKLATTADGSAVELHTEFTEQEVQLFEKHSASIEDGMKRLDGIAESQAYHLYEIDRLKLFKISGHRTMASWAEARFGISKGTVSDTINTFKRFGDVATGRVQVKYANYKFSNLMVIKGLSDAEIERLDIKADMPKTAIKSLLKKEGVSCLPDKSKKSDIAQVNEVIKEYQAITGRSKEEVKEMLHEEGILPRDKEEAHKPDAVKAVKESLEKKIKAITEAKPISLKAHYNTEMEVDIPSFMNDILNSINLCGRAVVIP